MPDDDLEDRLRRAFAARADLAPPPGPVEQRTLAAVRRQHQGGRANWFRAAPLQPVAVAAVVLAVVGATAGGVTLVRNRSQGSNPLAASPHLRATPSAAGPSNTLSPSGGARGNSGPTRTSTASGTSTQAAPVGPVGGAVPMGFRVTDLTFVSTLEGWALGTTPTCSRRPCTSLVRTTDGGSSWLGITPPVVGLSNVDSCTSACVSGVRFATPVIGYLFGPKVLYLTTDGGAHWVKQVGGATALEISGENVLRVSTTCSPGCPYLVQMSAVGATSWHQVLTPTGSGTTANAGLVRDRADAFVQIYANPAGGAGAAHSRLYRSGDNGTSWTDLGEPCPQNAGKTEIDSTAMAAGQKGTLAVLCRPRQGNAAPFVATFARGATKAVAGSPLTGLDQPIGALSNSVVFADRPRPSGQGALMRSTDGGRHWTEAQTTKLPPSSYSPGFLGFETATTGRWVSPADPSTVWTTTDAGAHWTIYTFPG